MKTFKKLALVALSIFTLTACDGSDDAVGENSALTLKLDHSVEIGETFNDGAGNEVTLTKLKYFITDLVLLNGEEEIEISNDIAATIIDLEEAEKGIVFKEITNVPTGTITGVKFNVGVSEENFNDPDQNAQGVLYDLALENDEDMFWNWALGYIYLKIEGTYTASTNDEHTDENDTEEGDSHDHADSEEDHDYTTQVNFDTESIFQSHIGNTGSGDTRTDRVMEVEIDFHGEEINYDGSDASIHLAIDVADMFSAVNSVDVSTFESVHSFSDLIPANVESTSVFTYSHQH